MTLTRTAVKARVSRKTNPALAETIRLATKEKSWFALAKILSGGSRTHAAYNLSEISNADGVKDGSVVVVPGKVLGQGQITKKISISALSFSSSASEKLKKSGVEASTIFDQIKKNAKAQAVVVIR